MDQALVFLARCLLFGFLMDPGEIPETLEFPWTDEDLFGPDPDHDEKNMVVEPAPIPKPDGEKSMGLIGKVKKKLKQNSSSPTAIKPPTSANTKRMLAMDLDGNQPLENQPLGTLENQARGSQPQVDHNKDRADGKVDETE